MVMNLYSAFSIYIYSNALFASNLSVTEIRHQRIQAPLAATISVTAISVTVVSPKAKDDSPDEMGPDQNNFNRDHVKCYIVSFGYQ